MGTSSHYQCMREFTFAVYGIFPAAIHKKFDSRKLLNVKFFSQIVLVCDINFAKLDSWSFFFKLPCSLSKFFRQILRCLR